MYSAFLNMLRWLVSLGAKFMRVTPGVTSTVVVATLVSQVAVLLAFFLPLKVLILLGSDGMPRYFPPAFEQFDRNLLVIWLSVATGVFYVLHLLAERVVAASTERGTARLLSRSQKLVLFENQNETAARGYQRYSDALASGVFVALALAAIHFMYLELALVLVGYIGLVVLVWLLCRIDVRLREALEKNLSQFLTVSGAVGFLLAFAYMVADHLFWSPPGLILAIISLLLSRQVFTRSSSMLGSLVGLSGQRARLDALFFHGKALMPDRGGEVGGMWPLLARQKRGQWLDQVLAELDVQAIKPQSGHWRQSAEPNVAWLEVPAESGSYLVKLFDLRRTSLALHEASLLTQKHRFLPAPRYLGGTRVGKFPCHVLSLPPGKMFDEKGFGETAARVRTDLLKVEPAEGLVQRYQRSRPMLWHYLDQVMVNRLQVAANHDDDALLGRFAESLGTLHARLRELPLWFFNPRVTAGSVFEAEDGSLCVLNWGRWRLEPVGAGWPAKRLDELAPALEVAAQARTGLSGVDSARCELGALSFALHKDFKRQRYRDALDLLPGILARLDREEST